MVANLRYFNSLELEVDSLRSQLETQKTQFLNEIDRISREYYYVDHMNAILSVYIELDEVTNLQCDYLKLLEKCKGLETKLSKSKMMSKNLESVQKHAINLELELQQCQEKIKNDKFFKVNQTKDFCKEREQYFEIQDLKAQLQDKGIVIRVIPTTSVSRPQLKSNPMGDRVLRNNSQGKKQGVEEQRRNVKLPMNKMSVTACNDSLNAKTLNVNSVSAMCDKCVLIDKHDMCVLNSVAKPIKKIVASESNQKPRNFTRKLYEHVSKSCSWWYSKFTPSGYKWKPKSGKENVNPNLVEIVLVIIDSGCSKHMTGNLKLLINFVEKFSGTRVYYVEGLNYNLFSVGQFCDADLEVAFRKSTCFIYDLKGNDLLTGSRGTDLYSITLQDTNCPNLICLMAKVTSSQAWLWHRRLNFNTINLLSKNDIVVGLPKLKFVKDHLCSSCELGKAKRKSFHTKLTRSSKRRLQLLHMDLCGPMRVASINVKIYVLVIVDDYSRYTWTHFLRSKDETPETLYAYFAAEGIHHQTSIARTPEQNGVVERRNRTFVEAARTMLSVAKVPLFFWAEAIETACFTQTHSLVIPRHEKTPYHIINDQKPSVKFFTFLALYATLSEMVKILTNKGERVIMESIHVNFDELPHMASDQVSSDLAPECQRMALEHDSLSPAIQRQANVPQADRTVTMSNELDLLFSLMFDKLLNGSSKVVGIC
nr:hypothetical protein [Tanacetum cinerariifolium]